MNRGEVRWVQPPRDLSVAHRPRAFKVVSESDDYIVCRTWDWSAQGTVDIYVAKPPMLRKSEYDGKTRNGITYTYVDSHTRTADNGSETQTEVIVPSYQAGDVLFAARASTGLTDPNGKPVRWQDLNDSGRAWAKQAT